MTLNSTDKKVVHREFIVIILGIVIFVMFLTPALLAVRAETRDGLRRQDITYLKRSMEIFFNENEFYPAIEEGECISSKNPNDWPFIESLPHDLKESVDYEYKYCVTEKDTQGTQGYFLEARLENDEPAGTFFDEDEMRKFYYRNLVIDDKNLYRVCGGTEKQCEK